MFRSPESGDEEEYIGNMWGWKFSAFSGLLVLLVFILTLPQQCTYWKTGSQEKNQLDEIFEPSQDSTQQ